MTDVKYDVIGIGNAMVDSLVSVDDGFLHTHHLSKGCMELIDSNHPKNAALKAPESKNAVNCAGGSAANTIVAMAQLGAKVAFIGKLGNDEIGHAFRADLNKLGIHYRTPALRENPLPTGQCMIFVTPEGERTMLTNLGAAVMLTEDDIDEKLIKNTKMVYLEGYLWSRENSKKAMRKMAKVAYENGRKIAFSLSDPFCVKAHKDEFLQLIKSYVSVLFSNEEEIKELYNERDLETVLHKVEKDCPLAVVTLGSKGAVAFDHGKAEYIPAEKIEKVIDTTGAGDMFAAGFMVDYVKDKPIKECVENGIRQASKIIQKFGARL